MWVSLNQIWVSIQLYGYQLVVYMGDSINVYMGDSINQSFCHLDHSDHINQAAREDSDPGPPESRLEPRGIPTGKTKTVATSGEISENPPRNGGLNGERTYKLMIYHALSNKNRDQS